ncbi:UNVERIFIED_CONTAM: hypothetical protein PYX00_011343 [Menopon gallinae]|uniref:AAA+ ATPase domain-containing protein n=1 Tax=Menopon gallinae TaxID=328185 RepID=A0AAW2H7E2_9NEOP
MRDLYLQSLEDVRKDPRNIVLLVDFVGLPVPTDLYVIEGLLRTKDLVADEEHRCTCRQAADTRTCENARNEFRSAGGRGDSEDKPKKTKTEGIDEESNVEAHIVERIKSEILHSTINIDWDDVVGLDLVKKNINEIVLWPMQRPDIFKGLRGPPKGLLLFGPPGTGKTMIGKCIASQVKATFFSISASSLTSKWVGEGEKMVRALFHLSRKMQPSVIFVDEIDSLLSQRSENENEGSRRIKTEFLVQFDGLGTSNEDRILLIGATNRPQEIDEAARRRLVKRIYVPLPEAESRKRMVRNLLSDYSNVLTAENLDAIAIDTDGYSGSDMFNLCREASLEPLREISDIRAVDGDKTRPIDLNDFKRAMRQIRKSVSSSDLELYQKWNERFGSVS